MMSLFPRRPQRRLQRSPDSPPPWWRASTLLLAALLGVSALVGLADIFNG
ncbi:hypothetical protein ACLE20_13925 [Rhizobium sp. YIM 134829]